MLHLAVATPYILSIPHFRIPPLWGAPLGAAACLSIPHFRIPKSYTSRRRRTTAFQFLILGYPTACTWRIRRLVHLSIPHFRIRHSQWLRWRRIIIIFQFLILGYCMIVEIRHTRPFSFFQFLILGYFTSPHTSLPIYTCFQFLILGYERGEASERAEAWITFNSSF